MLTTQSAMPDEILQPFVQCLCAAHIEGRRGH